MKSALRGKCHHRARRSASKELFQLNQKFQVRVFENAVAIKLLGKENFAGIRILYGLTTKKKEKKEGNANANLGGCV